MEIESARLNFEEAARLRDEIKRLREVELAVVDDPTARPHAGRQKGLATANRAPSSKGGRAGSRAFRGK